jgi:hypothetical protein
MRLELVQSYRTPADRAEVASIERVFDRAVRHLIDWLVLAILIGVAASASQADTVKPDPVIVLPHDIILPVPAVPPTNADPTNLASPGDVLTQRYNNLRTGTTLQIGLDQDAVRQRFGFIGILGSKDPNNKDDPNYIDGVVLAQPLFMEKVLVKGKLRSAVFIATSTNMVYAFDADTREQLWKHSLGDPWRFPDAFTAANQNEQCAPQMAAAEQDGDPAHPENTTVVLGIESTPVIDFARSRIIVSYRKGGIGGVLSQTGEQHDVALKAMGEQHIVALRLEDGLPDIDRLIEDNPNNPLWNKVHRNRASLLLDGDRVYVAFSGMCEEFITFFNINSYQGWIYAFDAGTLAPVGKWRSIQQPEGPPTKTTDDRMAGGGIWQASTGLAADGQGNLYVATGNQTKCGVPADSKQPFKCSPPDASGKNLSNSIVRLRVDSAPGGSISMTPVDWFTPYRKTWLDVNDLDFASAGLVLIPNTRYLVAGGKEGMLYVLDRDHLGRFDDSVPFDASKFVGPVSEFHTSGDSVGKDDPRRDQVVQKFQASESQYCAVRPDPLYCLDAGQKYPPLPPPGVAMKDWPPRGVTMAGWVPWAHIHGTPVFGAFPDGRAFLYLWAEKDFLKSFRWWGRRFHTTPTIAANPSGAVLAPPYLSNEILANGMPGGMLALTIDPTQKERAAGVLFASVQRCRRFNDDPALHECAVERCRTSTNCQEPRFGMLRAFDPITLEELWNNQSDQFTKDSDKRFKDYFFVKFVPPTIAHGRVFLPTGSRRVLVYGLQ